MKDIYIIQMHTGTIPSVIIKSFTRYKYSHVLIATNNSFKKMYSFGRKTLFNPFNAGLVTKLLNYFENNIDQYKYDIIGLFLKIMSLPIKRENHYVCTQFVAEILENTHIYEFEKSNLLVKPIDFEKIDNSNVIYTGYLNKYKNIA